MKYHVIGNGPQTVIALHGWFGSSRGWGPLPDLADTAAFRYVLVDCRGYGEARDETGEFTLAEIAADVLAVADELEAERFSLIGHSMGAAAAQKVLAQVPDRVVALVGINPVGPAPTPFDPDSRALFEGAAENPQNRFTIIDVTTGGRHSARWVQRMVDASLSRSTVRACGAYFQAWSTADFADAVRGASLPVLALVGEHDPVVTAEAITSAWSPLYPGLVVRTIGNAGHYPMDETPVNLITLIETFLSGSADRCGESAR